ncbi:MAG TPA: acyl-CoA dehydrogenase family protein, partial [Kofleriaceae bacterium]|nr:acyl-CoA dehydrogenase family protein [Kofleriaceae bacterium]
MLLPYPELPEADAEHLPLLLSTVRRIGARVDARTIDREMRIPDALLDELRAAGLFALLIPAAYGGLGLSPSGYARVIEEVAGIDVSLAVTLGGHQGIGCRGIALVGTPEQKQRYLPPCASGAWMASLGMTEPDAGSAIVNTQTRAVRQADGSWVLNGRKTYITNGEWSHVFTLFARTEVDKGSVKQDRLSAFIVERGPGVTSGPPMHKMGIRGSSTTEIFLDDARVPAENLLGPLGAGLRIARDVMTTGRGGLAAACLGIAKAALANAVRHANARRLGDQPIARFELIRQKIGDAAASIFAAESMVYLTTGAMGRSTADFTVEAAACKLAASETALRVTNDCLQIAGGAGYMQDLPYERMVRDARITTIFEGTSEVLRLLIAMNSLEGLKRRLERLGGILREGGAPGPELPGELAETAALAEATLDAADAGLADVLARLGGAISRMQLVQHDLAEIV